MIEPAAFFDALRRQDLTFFTGVPDSLLKDICAFINDRVDPANHVINANEGAAIGLAAGYHLGSGGIPVVYLQNSGFGNAINPLLSLADPGVYAIPMLVIVGWRGEPGVHDEPQHITQGRVMEPMLDAISIPYEIVGPETDIEAILDTAVGRVRTDPRPFVLLVRKGAFAPYTGAGRNDDAPLSRPRAIELVLDAIGNEAVVVSTTGMTSREVFADREERGDGHERDFLTVGSMGHCSQIALGLAKQRPDRRVVCLDGDGAVIMHLGSLAIIGTQAPANLLHIVINNGAHDSVGGQPTVGLQINLGAIASACGYTAVRLATSEDEVAGGITALLGMAGPSLLEIRVRSEAHTAAGRPTTTPAENKRALMRAIGADAD